jgi:hypothetical protein
MATTSTPIYAQKIQSWAYQFLPATTTTKTVIVAGGANGSQVTSLTFHSTDTAAMNMALSLYDGTTYYQLCVINIPAASGNASLATPPIDAFRNPYFVGLQFDPFGNKVLNVPSGWSLVGAMLVTITTAKVVNALAQGGDY